tara:strand:- start:170 stop:445 length:276 start_codon:yes stop_codon:yes gene_type:complete
MFQILLIILVFNLFTVTKLYAANNLNYPSINKVSKNFISANQAVKLVKQKYGGRVLKVSRLNQKFYKVKIVQVNGQVISKLVNAKTGQIKK